MPENRGWRGQGVKGAFPSTPPSSLSVEARGRLGWEGGSSGGGAPRLWTTRRHPSRVRCRVHGRGGARLRESNEGVEGGASRLLIAAHGLGDREPVEHGEGEDGEGLRIRDVRREALLQELARVALQHRRASPHLRVAADGAP